MKITKALLKQIIKEVLNEGRTGSSFGYTGGGDVSIRDDELRDAFEHRGIKVPFSLEDAELDSNKLRAMGFEYAPHDPRLVSFLQDNPSNPYAWTQGFWYDPQDDWRADRLSEETGKTKRPRSQADTDRMDLQRRGMDGPEFTDIMSKAELRRLNKKNQPKPKRKNK